MNKKERIWKQKALSLTVSDMKQLEKLTSACLKFEHLFTHDHERPSDSWVVRSLIRLASQNLKGWENNETPPSFLEEMYGAGGDLVQPN